MLLYGAGLRISELLHLTPSDIDSARMVIVVRDTKTRHDRLVPLSMRMLKELRAYWRARRPAGQRLFPGRKPGAPLTREAVSAALRKAAARAGLPKHLHPIPSSLLPTAAKSPKQWRQPDRATFEA